ncbi:MAG: hypothetical protein RLZZ157_677 [Pseudomonadota bacterium]
MGSAPINDVERYIDTLARKAKQGYTQVMLAHILKFLSHIWYRLARPMTLGVRVLAIDAQDRVCLVRHTYAPGWYLPGGGVERGESCLAAAIKEAREEAGLLIAPDAIHLVTIHTNFADFKGDHVLLYLTRAWETTETKRAFEIAESGFFPIDALPEGTTKGTMRRIGEYLGNPAELVW